ncbi:hypothetical protein pb186bvf_001564 [Paramecium bursaria]
MDQTEAFEIIDQSLIETEAAIFIVPQQETIQKMIELSIFLKNDLIHNLRMLVKINSSYEIFLQIVKEKSNQIQLALPQLKQDTFCQFIASEGIIHILANSLSDQTYITIQNQDQKLIIGKIKLKNSYILEVDSNKNTYSLSKEGNQLINACQLNNLETLIVIENIKVGVIRTIKNYLYYQNTSYVQTEMQIEQYQTIQFYQRDILKIGPYTVKLKLH